MAMLFSDAQREYFLREARERARKDAAEIKTWPYVPPGPPAPKPPDDDALDSWPGDAETSMIATIPLVSTAAMDAWRRDAEARNAAVDVEDERRRTATWLQRSNAAVYDDQQLDDRIAAAIAEAIRAEREFVTDVLIKLTVHFNGEISKLCDELREHQGSGRGADKGARILDLPNPLVRRAS
jgi:hypothetical protein